jgi:uncharacterized protein (TIGR02266 family)
MTQDTRKDPRAKIVSLNVRYKSATVDEFIENHSHDVSKGGIFIKTSTPFPQGTLLKFEIRLSGDQAVIAGVGRVVWKREASTSGTESPAGMGVKFIKIDENSRAVIDRLVGAKENAGIAFTSELEKKGGENAPAGAAALNSTLMGTGAPASGTSAPSRAGGSKTKSTIMGMGAVKDSTPAPGAATPAAGAGFFPPTNSQADMPPPEERTMMKQAAELLEEALKGAGGSMDEIGTNPLFAGPAAAAAKAASPATPDAKKDPDATSPPSTVRDTPLAKESAPAPISKPAAPAPATVKSPRPVAAVARESEPTPAPAAKKFPAWAWAPILLVVAGGLAFALKPDLFGGSSTAVPTPAPSTPVSVAPVDSVVPTATVDAAIAAVSDASALGVVGAKDAAAAKDSGSATATVVAPPVIAPPVIAPPVIKPPPPKPPTPAVTPEPPVDNTPKPTPVPKPAPPPKKPADDSDNPY